MQVFKTGKMLFWTNEIKSWAFNVAFAIILYLCFRQYSSMGTENISIGLAVLLVLKIEETLTPYHITEIKFDEQRNLLILNLYSPMSGDKTKEYKLEQVRSELIHHSGIRKLLYSSVTLKVLMTYRGMFKINSRYGFSPSTLTSIDKTLKLLNASYATT